MEIKDAFKKINERYEGVIMDIYIVKGHGCIEIKSGDTILYRSVDMNLVLTVDEGDSIYKLQDINECVVTKKDGMRYLVKYSGGRVGLTDNIEFPSKKSFIRNRYPNITVVDMDIAEQEKALESKNICSYTRTPKKYKTF